MKMKEMKIKEIISNELLMIVIPLMMKMQFGDYVALENFVWTDKFSVRCRLPFSEKPGPVRVLDSSDEIFNHCGMYEQKCR